MSMFERLGIVIGFITALIFSASGLISASSFSSPGGELLVWFGEMIIALTLEAFIFFMPRTFYWVRGDMQFFSSFSRKSSITRSIPNVLGFLPKNSELKEVLKGAVFVFLCSLGGNFIAGFLYAMFARVTTIPPTLQALANIISISFVFYLLARKQVTRTWGRLLAIAFVSWSFGIINIFISDEVTVATFFYGLPLVLLIMGLTSWIVFVCRKTPS